MVLLSKKFSRRIFLKTGVFSGLALLFTQWYGCSKDDSPIDDKKPTPNPNPNPNPPDTDITPKPGNDLYGVIYDENSKPVEGVVVSDGYTCVVTDAKGMYQMKKHAKADMVYYSTPSEYAIKTASTSLTAATFWSAIKEKESRYDFALTSLPKKETEFTLICIGDPQPTSAAEVSRFKTETMSDISKFLKTHDKPCYGVALGDITGDHPELNASMRSVLGSTTMPYFVTVGNHDHNKAIVGDDMQAGKTFQAVFGPLNYSFNRGDVHFVCLDNILYTAQANYTAGFTDDQIEWLRQDLSFVPKNKMVIVYYHIPLRNTTSYQNRAAMLNLLKGFANYQLMAGHTHYHENCMVTSTLTTYEHIHGAACGAWWKSTQNVDGTPNGYAVFEIKGNQFTNWFYKATNYPKEFQIRLHKGNTSFGGQYGYLSYNKSATTIVANIWNADNKWKIEAYEDGVLAGTMALQGTSVDAFSAGYHVGVLNRNPSNYGGTGSPKNKHLYTHVLKNAAAKIIEVRATDQFGNVYKQSDFISDLKTAAGY